MKAKVESVVMKVPLAAGPRSLGAVFPPSSTSLEGEEDRLTTWKKQFFVDSPFVRNFVVAASEVFATVQKEYKLNYPEPVSQKIVTSLSRMYRTYLLELCENLKSSGDLVSAELYSNLDFVWNFCEVMFISSHPDFPVLPYLMDWIRINFDLTSDILPKVIEQSPDLDESTSIELWNLINSHIYHGATQEAARLLPYVKHTEETKTSPSSVLDRHIALMGELLMKKPEFHPDQGLSCLTEFETLFQAWQEECLNRLENGAFHGSDNFIFICKVLCGDDEAFTTVAERGLSNWYEYMVLLLNYKYPTIRPGQLKAYAVKTLEQFGLEDKLEARDAILLQAMDFNIVAVLGEVQAAWDNPWCALHFSDLIFACGRNTSSDENVDYSLVTPLRNHLIVEFGTYIMEHETLWQMGIFYLESLPENLGRPIIRECLQRRNPHSELEAQNIIQVAEKFGFGDEIKGICRQVCLTKLRLGGPSQSQNALLWAIKAGDETLTTHIVDSILFEGDCEIDSALLDSLKNVLCCYGSLQFLHDFCSFRKCVSDMKYKEAVDLLCEMIKKDLIPKRIAGKILAKNMEIFENGQNFEPHQLPILMEYVQTDIVPCFPDDEEIITPAQIRLLNHKLIKISTFQSLVEFRNKRNLADDECCGDDY